MFETMKQKCSPKLVPALLLMLALMGGCGEEQPEDIDTPLNRPDAMAESVSYWDLLGNLNKIENLNIDLIPQPREDGSLPRSTGDFSLGMLPPRKGQQIRDIEVLLLQEVGGNRRIRLFSRNGEVYRIWTFIKKKLAVEDRDVSKLFDRVRDLFGEPDKEIIHEMVYIDMHTVLTFKSGGIYFMVEMQDIDRGRFTEDITLLIDEKMQEFIESQKRGLEK